MNSERIPLQDGNRRRIGMLCHPRITWCAKLLTTRILESVKQLNIERYKFVCLVTIGTKGSQDLRIASRCLWDDQFDTFVSVCFERQGFFAVGTVYGVYFE